VAAWTTSEAIDVLGGDNSPRRPSSPARSVVRVATVAERRDADVDATADADADPDPDPDAEEERKAAATPDRSSMIKRSVIRLKLPVDVVVVEDENILVQRVAVV